MSIIAQLRLRRVPAFAAVFREHSPFVWRVLRRHGVRDADLEDACQEVFVVVARKLEEFEGRSELRTWLYEIARRTALSERRKASNRRELLSDAMPDSVDGGPGPELAARRNRSLQWLDAALRQLDEEKREAFVLYELEEMTLGEVAKLAGCAETTVLYRLRAARDQIRAHVKRHELTGDRALPPSLGET